MDIQAGMELKVSLEGCGSPFKTIFVGEKTNEHMVLVLPENLTLSEKVLVAGSEVCAQYSVGDNRYEFKTKIREILKEPIDLILLDYPIDTYSAENRSRKRINCMVSAKLEFKIEEKDQLVVGVIENISKSGCRCVFKKIEEAGRLFSLGEMISLKCQFPGLAGEQTANGKIIHLQEGNEEIFAGIYFEQELWWVPPYDLERTPR